MAVTLAAPTSAPVETARPDTARAVTFAAAALVLPALAAVVVRLVTGPHTVDDAYITFRYARNLATGAGLVYNPGEWVLGTTTPLWSALLAALYWLGIHDLPRAATVVSALLDGGSAALLVLLGRRFGWGWRSAALVGAAWALNPPSVAYATGGMETSLFVLVEIAVLSLAGRRRFTLAALLAGIGVLVRPEALILGGLVLLASAWTDRRLPWRPALPFAAPVVAWAALTTRLYGSPLPHSVIAKQAAYTATSAIQNGLAFLVALGLPGGSTFLLAVLPAAAGLALAVAGIALSAALARTAVPRRWPPSSLDGPLWAAFWLAFTAFYVVAGLRGARLWPWYLVPSLPCALLLGAAAFRRWRGRWGAWLPLLLVLWQLPAIDWHQPFLPAGEDLRREAQYLRIGQELAASLPPGAVIAAPEIGALGYASDHPILDTVGLVSPRSVGYYPLPADEVVSDNAIPPKLIQDQRPAAVVGLDEFLRASLLKDPSFTRDYRLAAAYPLRIWASTRVLVYERVPEAGR